MASKRVGGIDRNHLLEALQDAGYNIQTARNILTGKQKMNMLDRAMKMQKDFKIECEFWETIYKK